VSQTCTEETPCGQCGRCLVRSAKNEWEILVDQPEYGGSLQDLLISRIDKLLTRLREDRQWYGEQMWMACRDRIPSGIWRPGLELREQDAKRINTPTQRKPKHGTNVPQA
jgi:hypothetical protein